MNPVVALISKPTQNQEAIGQARSLEDCVSLVKKYHQKSMARALDFVEAWFWLGASVARAVGMATIGDGVVEELAERTKISAARLNDAKGFFNVFIGEFDDMREWALRRIQQDGAILKSEMSALVRTNPLRREVGGHKSSINAKRERYLDEYPELSLLGNRLAATNGGVEKKSESIPHLREPLKKERRKSSPIRGAARRLAEQVEIVPSELISEPVIHEGQEVIIKITVCEAA